MGYRLPTWKYERQYHAAGIALIAGIDEVGVGALAGPVVAGAVVFPPDKGGIGGLGHLPYYAGLTARARELRQNSTEAEGVLWYRALRARRLGGYKFMRQKPLLDYIVDFWCAELMLAIEIDGDTHARQAVYDTARARRLAGLDILVVRYTNWDVLNNLEGVYQDLLKRVQERRRTLPISPLSGRGTTLLRDSKQLSAKQRERAAAWIKRQALAWAVGEATVAEISTLNILRASHLAMRRAVGALGVVPELLLIDGRQARPHEHVPAVSLIDGDQLCCTIAAASIVAKVHRDALMTALDVQYPGYGFAAHKGYGSAAHLAALRERGPSPIHRPTYAPVRAVLHRD